MQALLILFTNLVVSSIGEREVSLSWLTGFTGSPPIAIEMDVFPATGSPFRRLLKLGNVNATIITDLMPFMEYKFSIVVVNLDGRSEIVNISATTLSLGILATRTDTHVHLYILCSYYCMYVGLLHLSQVTITGTTVFSCRFGYCN